MSKKDRVAAIIGLWPNAEVFSKDLGLKRPEHGRIMKRRGSIPRKRWPRVLRKAEERGIRLTASQLEAAHAE